MAGDQAGWDLAFAGVDARLARRCFISAVVLSSAVGWWAGCGERTEIAASRSTEIAQLRAELQAMGERSRRLPPILAPLPDLASGAASVPEPVVVTQTGAKPRFELSVRAVGQRQLALRRVQRLLAEGNTEQAARLARRLATAHASDLELRQLAVVLARRAGYRATAASQLRLAGATR